jgi:amidophosphoribosyltransferase
MAKDVGAKKVIVASCAPPIRSVRINFVSPMTDPPRSFPNVYGIDMPSRKELVAHGRDSEAIATAIGADLVIFQTLPDLVECVRQLNPSIKQFDCSVFTGEYVTAGVDEEYLQHIESLRADNVREKPLDSNLGTLAESGVRKATTRETKESKTGASTPIGSDDTVGLHNSWHTS